ncbi:MAG TPA: hypothetical protein VMI94_02415 [Bryobacteraceae bacterium]|nr:hypothetical protein [Bryobacteraceae bacterium]
MKHIGGVVVAFLAAGPLLAQIRPAGPFGNVVFPAGRPASGNPWGNVVTPAMPQGAAALASGYNRGSFSGSFIRGFGAYGNTGRGHRVRRSTGIYAFPVYVGGYGYGSGYAPDQGGPPPDADQGNAPASQPPVIINQYFGTPPPNSDAPAESPANSNFHFYQSPTDSTDAAPAPEPSYYLIAFKDHTIYSAVAYYTEGDTLHYFTTGNVHNQVSLSLVDRELTEKLNRQHNVDLRLP